LDVQIEFDLDILAFWATFLKFGRIFIQSLGYPGEEEKF
jgi:hypothetical protein